MSDGANVWRFDPLFGARFRSWVGYDVRAKDGDLGPVEEMTTDDGRASLVVDTAAVDRGRRLVPAASVRSVNHDARTVSVGLTREQIAGAPPLDDTGSGSDDAFRLATSYYQPLL